jgi:hypothetical protein
MLKLKTIRRSLLSGRQGLKFFFDRCMTILLTPLLIIPSLVFSMIESVLGRGGTIEVYAVKKDKG